MANPLPNAFQNSLTGGQFGGLAGAQQATVANYQPYYPPPQPTWSDVVQLQNHIMSLQSEVIRLQRDLDKIKNTKEWLVGPENPSVDPSK